MSAVAYSASGGEERARPVGLPAAARPFFVLTCVAAAVAAAASVTHTGHMRWLDFAVLVAAGALAQTLAVHTPRNQVFHTGLAFTVAAALLLPPAAIVVVCVCQHVPEWFRQRYPWYIQTFNIANFTLSGLVAWGVHHGLPRLGADSDPAGATGVVVAAAAAAAFVLVNHLTLARMLRAARGHAAAESRLFSVDSLLTDAVLGGVGVSVAVALATEPAAAVVVALPLILIHRAFALPGLRALALRDHKTGLLNTRGIEEAARAELDRATRFGRPMSLLMIDVDDLRGINNEHGHLVGDAAITAVADAFRAELREYDLCARFGGDEFVVVFPEAALDDALAAAARIQARVAATRVTTSRGDGVTFTVSIGAAARRDGDRNIDDLMHRADAEMYAAKGAQRSGSRPERRV
jgi:diguanylate cyclase (GGDEF)-like protein